MTRIFHSTLRSLSQSLAILIITLIQLPAISLALDINNLTYSGLNLSSVPEISNTGSARDPEPLVVFSNATSFTVTDRAGAALPPGVATLYPSPISVSGLVGTITDVNVTISGLTVGRPRDLDILLVGPGGQTLVLMSDAGGTAGCGVSGINITLDDSGAATLPNLDAVGCPPSVPITSGTYRPTNITSGSAGDTPDVFPAPAPAGPHGTPAPTGIATLNGTFGGLNPNGTWNLYVVDDSLGNTGTTTIAGGWSIDITTAGGIAATNTAIVSNINPSTVGQNVTFTSTTTIASSGLPVTTGTVSFTQQGIAIAGCTGLAVNASGQAACSTAALGEGTRTIQATYSGTATLGTSNASLSQVVNSPTIQTGAQFCNNGGLSFPDSGTASVYPSNITTSNMFGTIGTVTATINGFNVPRPSNIDLMLVGPTGIAFEMMSDVGDAVNPANVNLVLADSGATQLGTGVLTSGTFRPTDHIEVDTFPAPAPAGAAQAGPTGTATFTNTFGGSNPNGTWRLFALDDGPGGGAAGTISGWCVTFTVAPFATSTAVISSADPSVFGQPVTFTATVTSSGGTPSGNVQFFDGVTPIGAPVALNGSGQASIVTSSLSVGNHNITAQYAGVTLGVGGGGFAASTGTLTGDPQVVNPANTTTVVGASVNPSNGGQQVTFTATVSAQSPSTALVGASGTVTFFRDGQPFCVNTALNASGQATCQLTFTVGGNYNITAQYSGTANFNASNNASAPHVQMVVGPTAANVAISGRVIDMNGRGVSGALVTMQSQEGNVITAVTNPFGYYRFTNVPSGQTYLISVRDKRYEFATRTVAVNEDLADVDFVAQAGSRRSPEPSKEGSVNKGP